MLKGVKILHKTKARGRLLAVRHAAWKSNGAEIVTSDHTATHIVVSENFKGEIEHSEISVVNEEWPSDCIELNRLLPVDAYLISAVPSPGPTDDAAAAPLHARAAGDGAGTAVPVGARASRQTAFSIDSNIIGASPNQHIIDFFHLMSEQRQSAGKEFSQRAYDRAITAIEILPMKITSVEQAQTLLPNVFKGRLREALDNILHDRISAKVLEDMRAKSTVLHHFQMAIYGVGAKRALQLYNSGCRTLQDVAESTTDPRMLKSIEHSEEMLQRISRNEVHEHFQFVVNVIQGLDPAIEAFCMGSYRRQARDCGDIDLILTKKGTDRAHMQIILHELVKALFDAEFAQFTFGEGESRWMGASMLKSVGLWRRMDILTVPYNELGAAKCYYTGDDMFNRCMRYRAQKMGLQLNDTGLFVRDTKNLIASATEREIFDALGIQWTEPQFRHPENFVVVDDEKKNS